MRHVLEQPDGGDEGLPGCSEKPNIYGVPMEVLPGEPAIKHTVAMPPILDAHVEDAHDAVAGSMVDHEIVCSQTCALAKRQFRIGERGNKKDELNEVGRVELCDPKVWTSGPSDKSQLAPSTTQDPRSLIGHVIADPIACSSGYTTSYHMPYRSSRIRNYRRIPEGPNFTERSRSYMPCLLGPRVCAVFVGGLEESVFVEAS